MSEEQLVYKKKKKKFKIFPIVNAIIFIIISLLILFPMWKVIVDSFDARSATSFRWWPKMFSLGGYNAILTRSSLYWPFVISVITTIAGTFFGLLLATLGGYVLIQWKMPGRNFFAYMLLFTMIFDGGMIPKYLVMQDLHLLDTLWAVILPMSINVYNLVLMRNFFEGIPESLFEAAEIDGCSPMGIFFRIVLPLSKAALASIGLMFAVTFWNDYTNFKIYIRKNNLYNFQIKLRNMVMDSNIPTDDTVDPNTIANAATIVAVLPFMIIYPFCQQYFVQGVNVGAVKE
ncbi:MAG: carbohydrate ABC transporter permease [Eubacteriales bacterium]|nr:carbohydrate ABC transporter permease [Eubacteriales bacterium]